MRTVSELSALAGVTARALHHYDEIGLPVPSERSEAGYRLYSGADLERLQEILVWRQLGFTLAEIQAMLDDPGHDRGRALRRQRELVALELERRGAAATALDAALAAHESGRRPEEHTMFEGFDNSAYEEEARERWGHTEAYRESARRAAAYGPEQWADMHAEQEAIERELAELMRSGMDATGEPAMAAVERHRQLIERWFHACSRQTHRGLGEMYVTDERFARHYDERAPGLATFVRDAIVANARRAGAGTTG